MRVGEAEVVASKGKVGVSLGELSGKLVFFHVDVIKQGLLIIYNPTLSHYLTAKNLIIFILQQTAAITVAIYKLTHDVSSLSELFFISIKLQLQAAPYRSTRLYLIYKSLTMLLSSKKQVHLHKNYHKVLFLSVAVNNTFVFLGMSGNGKDVLVHCNEQGSILYEYQFSQGGTYNSVDTLGMLSDREVMVLQTHRNKIQIFQLLQPYQRIQFDHQFLDQSSQRAYLETFSQTRYICIRQVGNYSDHRMKLTYYQWPLQKGNKPIAIYESQDDQWTHQHLTSKGNSHSLIIWYKSRHDEQFQFSLFDLHDEPKGKYRVVKVKNTIGEPYHLAKVECALINIWETKKNQFMVVCISNKTENKAVNAQGVVNNNFIVDADQQTIRQVKFTFEPQYNDFLIDIFNIGSYSMFRTFNFSEGKVLKSPAYYINNETEQLADTDQWQCTYRTKYFFPGFDSSLLVESEFQNADVSNFTVYSKKVMDPKQISLHFLLHINQDFDDDLLKDAVELLEP